MSATKPLHSVPSDESPSPRSAINELTKTINDLGTWLGIAQQGERTQLCLWPSQSDDNRKWDKNYGRPVMPWDGCADTRVRLVDASVQELLMLQVSAFFSANPAAVQQEAHDAAAASKVQTLLKYEIRQRMRSELWAELNFLTAWTLGMGHGVMETRWKDNWVTGNETLTAQQLADWLAEATAEQMEAQGGGDADAIKPVLDEQMQMEVEMTLATKDSETALTMLQAKYPALSKKRAMRVVRDLEREGSATFRLPVKKPGRPQVIARCPGIDIFYPWYVDDIKNAPWVCVVDTLSEPELLKKPVTEGWDKDFVDILFAMGPTPAVDIGALPTVNASYTTPRPIFDNTTTKRLHKRIEELRNCYQVLRFRIKAVDEDGIECEHELVCHPSIGYTANWRKMEDGHLEPKVALERVLDNWHEGGDFVAFRREYKERAIWSSRSVPEMTGGYQWELKKSRDGMIDRNDLAVNPPLRYSSRNAAGRGERLGIRPGAGLQERKGEESSWMTPPVMDPASLDMEERVRAENANLLGLSNEHVPQAKTMLHQQFLVTGFLIQCRELLLRIIGLDQQFMDPLYVSRVIGGGPLPFQVTREEIAGQFDVAMEFDVRMLDMEYVKARWDVIKEAYQSDRSGVMNDEVITRWLLSSIDSNLADMAVGEASQVSQKEADDEKEQLAIAAMGVVIPPKQGGNAKSRLSAIEEQMTTNPKLASLYQTDPSYKAIVDARGKKYQLDISQQKNAVFGRDGWVPPDTSGAAVQ
jgi:hypothetical protein